MSSPEEVLRSALAAHNAGRLTEAEVGYSRVLRKHPAEHRALYGLGLLRYHSGSREEGIQYIQRSLESAPDNGRGWVTLGSMYVETGRTVEGRDAYQRATRVSPGLSAGWYNVGICLKREGDFGGAIEQLRQAVGCSAPLPEAHDALAALLYEQGRFQEAAQALADWARHDPSNPKAQHMGAAASAGAVPARAADDYVRVHFDAFAEAFDRNLKELNYQAPELVAKALRGFVADEPHWHAVLDAGCGTGLCGPLLRPLCQKLVGVDLSPGMLSRAQTRACYDELIAAELGAFMRSRPAAFDAIVCADTLVYFGPLAEPLEAAHQALRAGGPLVFTVEALGGAEDHRLELTGRYSHSEHYLRHALGAAGFEVSSLTRETLREERSSGVPGYLVVARRA